MKPRWKGTAANASFHRQCKLLRRGRSRLGLDRVVIHSDTTHADSCQGRLLCMAAIGWILLSSAVLVVLMDSFAKFLYRFFFQWFLHVVSVSFFLYLIVGIRFEIWFPICAIFLPFRDKGLFGFICEQIPAAIFLHCWCYSDIRIVDICVRFSFIQRFSLHFNCSFYDH